MDSIITLDPFFYAVLIGIIAPIVTGLVTKYQAASGVKAVVGFVFVTVATGINYIISYNGTFALKDFILLLATTFAMHTASYYGFWKPVPMGDNAAPGSLLAPRVGIGKPS